MTEKDHTGGEVPFEKNLDEDLRQFEAGLKKAIAKANPLRRPSDDLRSSAENIARAVSHRNPPYRR